MLKVFKKSEHADGLVGKIVFFGGALGHQRVGRPHVVVSETRATITCKIVRFNLVKNHVPHRSDEIPAPWINVTIEDVDALSITPFFDDEILKTKRKDSVLYVADNIESAMPLYNASCRLDREIDIFIKKQYKDYKVIVGNLLNE